MREKAKNKLRTKRLLSLLLAAAMFVTTQGFMTYADTVSSNDEKAWLATVENNTKTAQNTEQGVAQNVNRSTAQSADQNTAQDVETDITPEGAAIPANPVHHCTGKDDGTDTTTWSYVYFGSYPQSEVTDTAVIAAIDSAIAAGNGTTGADNTGTDVWVSGIKYRRISEDDTNNSNYFLVKPTTNGYCYFKWERIKWRVLDNNDNGTLFVVADSALDCKDYHDDGGSITWEASTIRNWLNGSFYNTAFSNNEQNAIVTQKVVNEDNPYYGTEGGNDTTDKVYLLSMGEVTNSAYGFCNDYSTYSASRWLQTSIYARARGAYTDYFSIGSTGSHNANCYWWLRSPAHYIYAAAYVGCRGTVFGGGVDVARVDVGVVPALHINLSSDIWSVVDDGTSGDGGNGGTGEGISGGIGNVTTTKGNDIAIYVYDIGDGTRIAEPLENAAANVENFGSAATDADGKAVIANSLTDQPLLNTKVSITKEGYREYYFYKDIYNKDAELLWDNNTIYATMQGLKEEDKTGPYISTLMCRTSYGKIYNAMTGQERYYISEDGQSLNIQMNAVWNGKTPSSYVLYQENGSAYTSKDGKFQLDMGMAFQSTAPIYAKLVASDGTTVTEKTKFVMEKSMQTSTAGNGLELIDTDSTGSLGEDVAFLSGQSVSVKLKGVNIDVSVDSGKVRATIGKGGKLSEGDYLEDEEWEDWKKLCEHQPKDLNLSQWKNVIESIDTDWVSSVKGKTEVYGYLEGVVNSSGSTILTGKLKLKTSLSVGMQAQYTIGVVPVYAKISFGVNGGAEGVFSYDLTNKKIDSEKTGITLSVEPYLAAEGGVGVMAVATVGVEGKGSMPFSTKLGDSDNAKLSVKGGLSLKAKLLAFEYSLKIAEREWKLMPQQDRQLAADTAGLSVLSMDDFELSAERNAGEDSLWLGESAVQTRSLDTTETGSVERLLKTNINPDAQMQIVDTGSTKMILWTEEDADREIINSSKLVYSIYDESRDTWSEPVAVADDKTADYAPTVVTDGERIYVAWQNIDQEFDNTAGLSQVAAASTIAMSVWTKETGFSNAQTVSKSDCMAASPKIALNAEGNLYVAYLQNTENNLLLTTGENNILCSVIKGGSIEQKTLIENAGLVTALDTAYTNDYEISYTLDTDGDLSTLEDREIIRRGAENQSTQNACIDSNVQYVKNGNQVFRFWYQDGCIVSDMEGKETVICEDETGALTDDFRVVSGQENQLAIIWTAVDEDGNKQIEGSLYDADTKEWSRAIRIFDTDAGVYNPQGIFTQDGKLQFLYKKTNETRTDLCVLMAQPSVNLAIENAYADQTTFEPGNMAKISVQVKNNGTKRADGFSIDAAGTKTKISESIAPGESIVVEADYKVPSDLNYQTVDIAVETDDDIDTADNHFALAVGYTDLAINLIDTQYEFGEMIEVYAANESCVDTEAALEIRKNSREGELIDTVDLGTITKGEMVAATYLWNEDAENYSADADALYFEVVSQKPEQYTNNNYDFAVIETYVEPGSESGTETGDESGTNPGDGSDTDTGAALKETKNKAKNALETYKDAKNYREAQKKELAEAIASGKAAIDAAANSGEVNRALNAAKAAIDGIKTDAQLTKEEKEKEEKEKGESVGNSSQSPITISSVAISKTSYSYDGKKKNPNVTVKAGNKKLTNNTDYTVSYQNNVEVGTASVVVTGSGEYTGTITKTFEILPKKTSISGKPKAGSKGFTVQWKKQKNVTGYQVQYSTNKKFAPKATVTKTVKKKSTVKLTVRKLKAKKKYYVRVRTYKTVKGKKYYSGWSKSKTVTTKK